MNADVKNKFDSYPDDIRAQMMQLRTVIFEVAASEQLGDIDESLKWGEPSYNCQHGSAVRINWKADKPDHLSVYFNCNTSLIATFSEIYAGRLNFNGNREIVVTLNAPLPMAELRDCFSMALRYHQIKHLPLLGA